VLLRFLAIENLRQGKCRFGKAQLDLRCYIEGERGWGFFEIEKQSGTIVLSLGTLKLRINAL